MLRVVEKGIKEKQDLRRDLDEVLREGGRRLLAAALEADVSEYLAPAPGKAR